MVDAEGVLEDRDVAEAGDGEDVGQDGPALPADERLEVELVPELRHQRVHEQLNKATFYNAAQWYSNTCK